MEAVSVTPFTIPRGEWHEGPVPTVTPSQLLAENRALRDDNARLVKENRQLKLALKQKGPRHARN